MMKLVVVAVTGLAVALGGITLARMQQASAQVPGDLDRDVAQGQPGADVAPGNFIPPGANPYQAGGGWKSHDPEMVKLRTEEARLERDVMALLRDYARAKEDEARSKVKEKLSAVLDKQFDLQQKRRKLEVDRIEAELKKLRDLMQKRTDARKTIVEKRLDQLVREADGLGWTPPPNVPIHDFSPALPEPRPAEQ
jgi:hypothetical protein